LLHIPQPEASLSVFDCLHCLNTTLFQPSNLL
jgi:hypothetical protein